MNGNCMFSSIAHQLYSSGVSGDQGVQITASDLRTQIVDVLETDKELAARVVQGLEKSWKHVFYIVATVASGVHVGYGVLTDRTIE